MLFLPFRLLVVIVHLIAAIVIEVPQFVFGTTDNLNTRQRKEIYEGAPTAPKNPSPSTLNRKGRWDDDNIYW